MGLKCVQVSQVVLLQALLLGAVALLPGAAVGVGLAYLINRAAAGIGPPLVFQVDVGLVAGCGALGLVNALLAGLFPARRAARQPVIQALRDG